MNRSSVIIGIVLLTAAVAAGCGGQAPPAAPVSSPANVINISEREWSITLTPASVNPGTYTINVKNDGTIEHDFVIQGLSVRMEGIQAGQSKTTSVQLTPGTYTVICDLPGHADAGMKTTLTVR